MRLTSFIGCALGFAATGGGAKELTMGSWDKEVAGKSVFVKFLAPWWGHCKSMKPAWDKLIEAYKGNPTSLVADVDCTADGKSLCEKVGVRGYPTIKYGDPDDLKDYKGGRDFDSLKKFADSNLGPQCGPANLDLCDAKMKPKYEKFLAMTKEELKADMKAATQAYEVDVPMMKKVIAHKKKEKKKEEL